VILQDFSVSKQSAWRFRHAKAYFAVKGERVRAGIGSCNFTEAGLSGEEGNVESMIVSDLEATYISDIRDALKQVRLIEDDFETNPVDDAPQHLPFIITVLFDWQKHAYSYTVDMVDGDVLGEMLLHLPGIETAIPLRERKNSGELSIERKFKRIDNYRVCYTIGAKHLDHVGPIIEINFDYSEKEYTRTPSVEDILRSWSSSDESWERLSKFANGDDGEDDPSSAGVNGDVRTPDQPANDILGYYDIYRAFYDLRAKLKKAREEKNSQKVNLYIERRSDSLRRLFSSIENIQDLLRRYLLLVEINQITKEYARFLVDTAWSGKAKEMEVAARAQLNDLVARELQGNEYPRKVDAQQLLGWFDSKLKN
jgi:hypothetical protein